MTVGKQGLLVEEGHQLMTVGKQGLLVEEGHGR